MNKQFKTNVTFYLQCKGSVSIVGLSGPIQEIIHWYYSFLNLKMTEGELHWASDRENFAYIYLSKYKFDKWLEKSSIRVWENWNGRDFKGARARREVDEIIARRRAAVIEETFIRGRYLTGGAREYKMTLNGGIGI